MGVFTYLCMYLFLMPEEEEIKVLILSDSLYVGLFHGSINNLAQWMMMELFQRAEGYSVWQNIYIYIQLYSDQHTTK